MRFIWEIIYYYINNLRPNSTNGINRCINERCRTITADFAGNYLDPPYWIDVNVWFRRDKNLHWKVHRNCREDHLQYQATAQRSGSCLDYPEWGANSHISFGVAISWDSRTMFECHNNSSKRPGGPYRNRS